MRTNRTLTLKDAVRYLTLHDPNLTPEQIQQRLDWLGLPECTLFLISQIRAGLRSDMRFLERVGLLRNRKPLIPACIRRLKPPQDEPVKEFHYRCGDD
jgi:hypothetical protein